MQINLNSAADVEAFATLGAGLTNQSVETETNTSIEFIETLRPVVPAVVGSDGHVADAAREVTEIRVKIRQYADGEVEISGTIYGWPLTKAGNRHARQIHGSVYVGNGDEIRWELRRFALLRVMADCNVSRDEISYGAEYLTPFKQMRAELAAHYKKEAEEWEAKIKAREAAKVERENIAKSDVAPLVL